jgi:hypothetical protein
MKIFNNEIQDGVSELVLAQSAIAYCSPIIVSSEHTESAAFDTLIQKIKAESANPKQFDLYYLKSVLVSTGWNKNDDVFSPQATWAARNTPEDKQFNFMHNENDIIGHITGSYVVTKSGDRLQDDAEMPEEFDIITEAVLYNSWTNAENRERMNKIIEEIEEGKWFVSMECLFAGFDYSVVDGEGEAKVIARTEESSFLTKHLRAYGGTGEYEGYKIGRSLRDISFSGKGLVSKPANPRSVILDASKAFSVNESDVINNVSQGDLNMSDTNVLEKQLAEVRNELASALEENKAIRAQIETAKDKEYADTIASLEGDATAKSEEITSLNEKLTTAEEAVKALEETIAAKDAEMMKKEEEMKKMKKEKRDNVRKASLVEAGFEPEEAEESLALYDALEDEKFDSIVAMYKKKMSKDKMSKDEKMKMEENKAEEDTEDSQAEEEVSEELFDGVKSAEATLVDASNDTDELEATRASVAEWLENNVLNK